MRVVKRRFVALIAAVMAFFAMCLLFSGMPEGSGLLASLDPVAAVGGLSFALAFALGLPSAAAIAVAIAVFVLVPAAVFLAVSALLRRMAS